MTNKLNCPPLTFRWKTKPHRLGPSTENCFVNGHPAAMGWVSFAATVTRGDRNKFQGTVLLPGFKTHTAFRATEAEAKAWVQERVQSWLDAVFKEPKPDA